MSLDLCYCYCAVKLTTNLNVLLGERDFLGSWGIHFPLAPDVWKNSPVVMFYLFPFLCRGHQDSLDSRSGYIFNLFLCNDRTYVFSSTADHYSEMFSLLRAGAPVADPDPCSLPWSLGIFPL